MSERMTREAVEALLARTLEFAPGSTGAGLLRDYIATLDALDAATVRAEAAERRLAKMRKALKPFAEFIRESDWTMIDGWTEPDTCQWQGPHRVGEYRRARAALQDKG